MAPAEQIRKSRLCWFTCEPSWQMDILLLLARVFAGSVKVFFINCCVLNSFSLQTIHSKTTTTTSSSSFWLHSAQFTSLNEQKKSCKPGDNDLDLEIVEIEVFSLVLNLEVSAEVSILILLSTVRILILISFSNSVILLFRDRECISAQPSIFVITAVAFAR